jgi:hypothetical protein
LYGNRLGESVIDASAKNVGAEYPNQSYERWIMNAEPRCFRAIHQMANLGLELLDTLPSD